jgi:ferredoxin
MTETFETALSARVDAMADACTRCGKCVEVCPVTGPAASSRARRRDLRYHRHPQDRDRARRLAQVGERLRADRRMHQGCDYGINPRFMLNMARVRMAQHDLAPGDQRRGGVDSFRKVAREVAHISRCSSATRC